MQCQWTLLGVTHETAYEVVDRNRKNSICTTAQRIAGMAELLQQNQQRTLVLFANPAAGTLCGPQISYWFMTHVVTDEQANHYDFLSADGFVYRIDSVAPTMSLSAERYALFPMYTCLGFPGQKELQWYFQKLFCYFFLTKKNISSKYLRILYSLTIGFLPILFNDCCHRKIPGTVVGLFCQWNPLKNRKNIQT